MAKCAACGAAPGGAKLKMFQQNPPPQQHGQHHTQEGWHLKKEVPIALILTLVLQTSGIVWWAATIQAENKALHDRVVVLERQAITDRALSERMARMEERVGGLQDGMARIESLLRQIFQGGGGPRL